MTMAEKRTGSVSTVLFGRLPCKHTVTITAHKAHPTGLAIKNHQNSEIAMRCQHAVPEIQVHTYTILLSKVQQAPTKVRKATLRRRALAVVLGRFL